MHCRLQALRPPRLTLGHVGRSSADASWEDPDCVVTASGIKVCFNAKPATADEAQAVCGKQCGHVVSYGTQAEQDEVESTYTSLVGVRAVDAQRAGCCRGWKRTASTPVPWRAPADTHAATLAAGPAHPQLPHLLLDGPQGERHVAQLRLGGPADTWPCRLLRELGHHQAGPGARAHPARRGLCCRRQLLRGPGHAPGLGLERPGPQRQACLLLQNFQ
jgi:hypothetical protein